MGFFKGVLSLGRLVVGIENLYSQLREISARIERMEKELDDIDRRLVVVCEKYRGKE